MLVKKNGIIRVIKISRILDHIWQYLISFSLEPAHEAIFHPHNFGYRRSVSLFELQKIFFLNLNKEALGFEKRIFSFNIKKYFFNLNFIFY